MAEVWSVKKTYDVAQYLRDGSTWTVCETITRDIAKCASRPEAIALIARLKQADVADEKSRHIAADPKKDCI